MFLASAKIKLMINSAIRRLWTPRELVNNTSAGREGILSTPVMTLWTHRGHNKFKRVSPTEASAMGGYRRTLVIWEEEIGG
jgi:hypothetical protein